MGRILSPAPLLSAPPLPYSLLPTRALDAALRYIAEFAAAVLSQYGLCLGLSRLHDLPHLSLLVWGRFMAARQPAYPDGFLHSGFELLPAVV